MSKDGGGRNSSFSEKPVRSHRRRLVDWINLTGAKKVHSLIDQAEGTFENQGADCGT